MGCLSGYNQTTQSCSQTADEGYNQCSQSADEGYNQCNSWGIFSFLCDAWTWVSNIVCVAWTWISNVVCVAWNVVTTFICVVWDVITTVVNFITETINSLLAPVLNALATIIQFLFSIPILGRILNWIWNVVTSVVSLVASAVDAVAGLLGIRPEKRMYLLVLNQQDERGNLVATEQDILASVGEMIKVYREQANIRVLPVKLFNYRTAASGDEQASDDYIVNLSTKGTPQRLDVDCGPSDLTADLGNAGADFQNILTLQAFWTNWRRLIGYGAPVCAFSVRSFTGSSDGCSIGPLTDYVLVNFSGAAKDLTLPAGAQMAKSSILPHESGHACNLFHVGPPNLMAPNDPRAVNLDGWQVALVRASRHVTYF